MRTARQHELDRAVIRTLRDIAPRRLSGEVVGVVAARKADYLQPLPSVAETDEALRHAEREGRALGVPTETGMTYKLTADGEAWALENRL